jgi:CBS domain containing-hemolysin-like protein
MSPFALMIAAIGVAFGVSFLCSLTEAALLSVTPGQLADLAARRRKTSVICRRLKRHIERPIAVILTLNTVAHTVGATIAGSEFAILYGNKWIGLFSGVFTYLMLQYTEILPKTLGIRFNSQILTATAYPLSAMIKVLAPFIYLLRLVNRPFESKQSSAASASTIDEIRSLAALARMEHDIGAHQERIIAGASRLAQIAARKIMIPVEQITFLSTSQSLGQAIVAAHIDPHTRFPILDGGDRDRVLGYVNFKELVSRVRTNPLNPTMHGIIRPVCFVPAEARCSELLKNFVDQHVHVAIVRDGAGKTLGLITLEDIVEQLVGPVGDEFDSLPKHCHLLSGNVWLVGGGMTLRDASAHLGVPLSGREATISEWIVSRLGRSPAVNDSVNEGGAQFLVRRVRRSRVYEVSVMKSTPEDSPAERINLSE